MTRQVPFEGRQMANGSKPKDRPLALGVGLPGS